MGFTGRLGTESSRLGTIVLGAVESPTGSGSLSIDAVIEDAPAFSIDAVIQGAGGQFDFTANAVIKGAQSHSFTIDAAIAPTSTHHREHDHFDTQADTFITYLGQPLNEVLADLYAQVSSLSAWPLDAQRFSIAAWVQPYFALTAVVSATTTASIGFDAIITMGGTFGASAIVRSSVSDTATISAFLI